MKTDLPALFSKNEVKKAYHRESVSREVLIAAARDVEIVAGQSEGWPNTWYLPCYPAPFYQKDCGQLVAAGPQLLTTRAINRPDG